ncbi:ATP-binding cassette domain-containing protein [Anaerosporobacter faecicola]|uniref:ATP-binding cassette domain-containing protein n=1 Tax=Anaerosporobacter faecicola TaxID=2718714 RepID=UPI00143A61D9|nr:excinuclease ABC subunit UvrA [Anaerosporobacter faecicola]
MDEIIIKGLTQNNLKHLSFRLPKKKIIVFTGVSGSGKSSIVFDTIAAESQRQINETYTAFVRGRLPKYEKPQVELIENLTASVIVDQSQLGGNIRSTVGTISDLYATLRLLFSRIGQPYAGTASYFSFNDPNGMCKECAGIGKVTKVNVMSILDKKKSWNEGPLADSMFKPGSWYWQQYTDSGLFDVDKKLEDYTEEEFNLIWYGSRKGRDGERENPKVEGLQNQYERLYLKRDISSMSSNTQKKSANLLEEKECPVCKGKRLNQDTLNCKILGYSITDLCDMEFQELREVLLQITDPRATTMVTALVASLDRMIDIGLSYLHMNRESSTLSGGEAQRLKLVRYMGSALSDMTYIFDEPSTGLHPRDVHRMNELLIRLRDKGNTVLVVEHDEDVIKIADMVVDVGPYAGKQGGEIVFQGSYSDLLCSDTLTGKYLTKPVVLRENVRKAKEFLPIRNANLHNLKNVDVDIPLHILTVITGVAGSGKSTLISDVFAKQYENDVITVNQSPITASSRSMPATYLGFFDEIRKLFAVENQVEPSVFSFNSKGACPVCQGKGVVITELVFMDPVVTQCEACNGSRYSEEALSYTYQGKNIMEVLQLTVEEAITFFAGSKIVKILRAMKEVGLAYMTLGQPLSTLSGGELQRIKLAKYLDKKGNIYILDEPTTGLHVSDVQKLMDLFHRMVERGNTVLIIEHNVSVMRQADWIIDVGPEGGKNGGQVVFQGTPKEMVEKGDTITAEYIRKMAE